MRYPDPTNPDRPRTFASFGVSGSIHAGLLLWLAISAARLPHTRPRSLYDQGIRPYEKHLVWYNLREKLPDIAPSADPAAPQRPRARQQFPQALVAGPKDDARPSQLILTEAPPAELPKPTPLPNVVAVTVPPRPARIFTPPPEAPPAPAPPPVLPDAPPVAAKPAVASRPLESPTPRPTPRPFKRPPDRKPALPVAPPPVLPDAPLVATVRPQATAAPLPVLTPRPKPLPFHPPPPAARPPATPLALPDAPPVQPAPAPDQPLASATPKPRPRPFQPPVATPTPPPAAPPQLDVSAPAIATPATPAADSLAIASLEPSRFTEIPVPPPSHSAAFSGAPQPAPEASGTVASGKTALVVPSLTAGGGARDALPTLAPSPEVSARSRLMAELRTPLSPDLGYRPGLNTPTAPRVSSSPDPRLNGRVVYAMAIQMPNVTSYSGSWMVWFAERVPQPGAAPAAVRPPEPRHKVDPAYIRSAADQGIEGVIRLAAVIGRDGRVDRIELLRGIDNRLDESAVEALGKWLFEPALRDGVPIDVDAVFEVPFRLAPRPSR